MKTETTMGSHPSLSDETTEASHLPLAAIGELHRHWVFFFALGVGLIVLGTIGILVAGLFTVASVLFFGSLLLIAGAALTIHAFWAKRWSGFFLQFLSGLLNLVAGCVLAMRPELSAIALTLVIAISLVVQGAFRIGAALAAQIDGWGSLLASGVITLLIGLMIWNEWPFSGVWAIGLFVGIDMFFYGAWLVSLALSARTLANAQGADRI